MRYSLRSLFMLIFIAAVFSRLLVFQHDPLGLFVRVSSASVGIYTVDQYVVAGIFWGGNQHYRCCQFYPTVAVYCSK
jgi:hypothetical protein